jgi:hypothetical protein
MVLFPSTWSRVRLRILYLIMRDISRKVNGLVPLHLVQGEVKNPVPDYERYFQEGEWSCSPPPAPG